MSKKDIFRNKKDFAKEEFATSMPPNLQGIPQPRETRSQKAQMESLGTPGHGRKDRKVKMSDKRK